MLHTQCDQLANEMDIVRWYIDVFENGHDTRNLLKDFVDAQAEIKTLQTNLRNTKAKLEKKLSKRNKELNESKAMIIKLQKDVVKNLIQEVKIKDALNKRLLE